MTSSDHRAAAIATAPPRAAKRARPKPATPAAFATPLLLTARRSFTSSSHPLLTPRSRRHSPSPTPAPTPVRTRPARRHAPPTPPTPLRVAWSATASGDVNANLTTVSDRFLRAVETLSRQPRQTVSDLAATAGLPLSEAADEAVRLAAIVSAPIDVTADGDLAYRFPSNVRAKLRARSALSALTDAWRRAAPALFLFARVAFGALLIISIVVTFLAIAALSAASRSSDDDRRQSSGPMFAPRLFAPNPFDIMFYSSSSSPRRERREGEMSFFEAVYSFVFGDADPNADFEDRRWRTVAAVIRANRGAVTAEQLAPYLDPTSASDAESGVVDEAYVLPALTRFQGRPEVTDAGDIIYVFPDFVKTGRVGARTEIAGSRSTLAIQESEVPLTRAPPGQRALVTALGIVNIGGVLVLGSKLLTVVPMTPDAAALIAGVRALYGPLFLYATSFFVVPAVRWLRLRKRNKAIQERNAARDAAARALRGMDFELRRKLDEAEKYVVKGGQVGDSNVVFSSDRDSIDQISIEEDAADDFDRRLKG